MAIKINKNYIISFHIVIYHQIFATKDGGQCMADVQVWRAG